mgnify:CR=1 FL=1
MIKTGNLVISIYTEMTPNPETMKFVANKLLYPGKSIDFPEPESPVNTISRSRARVIAT